jgi:hypothetical protein
MNLNILIITLLVTATFIHKQNQGKFLFKIFFFLNLKYSVVIKTIHG